MANVDVTRNQVALGTTLRELERRVGEIVLAECGPRFVGEKTLAPAHREAERFEVSVHGYAVPTDLIYGSVRNCHTLKIEDRRTGHVYSFNDHGDDQESRTIVHADGREIVNFRTGQEPRTIDERTARTLERMKLILTEFRLPAQRLEDSVRETLQSRLPEQAAALVERGPSYRVDDSTVRVSLTVGSKLVEVDRRTDDHGRAGKSESFEVRVQDTNGLMPSFRAKLPASAAREVYLDGQLCFTSSPHADGSMKGSLPLLNLVKNQLERLDGLLSGR